MSYIAVISIFINKKPVSYQIIFEKGIPYPEGGTLCVVLKIKFVGSIPKMEYSLNLDPIFRQILKICEFF